MLAVGHSYICFQITKLSDIGKVQVVCRAFLKLETRKVFGGCKSFPGYDILNMSTFTQNRWKIYLFFKIRYILLDTMYIPPKHFFLGLMTWGKDDDFDIFTYLLKKKNCLAVNHLIVYIDEKCPNSYHFSRINMYTDIKSMLD